MSLQLVGGIIYFKVDGVQYRAKGKYTYNLGNNKREMVMGVDGPHGYKATPQVAFIDGAITDGSDIDVSTFQNLTDTTVTLTLANGKTVTLHKAFYSSPGDIDALEGEIKVRFEGSYADEVA